MAIPGHEHAVIPHRETEAYPVRGLRALIVLIFRVLRWIVSGALGKGVLHVRQQDLQRFNLEHAVVHRHQIHAELIVKGRLQKNVLLRLVEQAVPGHPGGLALIRSQVSKWEQPRIMGVVLMVKLYVRVSVLPMLLLGIGVIQTNGVCKI